MEEGLQVETRYFDGVNLALVKDAKGKVHDAVIDFLDNVAQLKGVCEDTPCFA